MSTVAACGVIMFNNNRTIEWLINKNDDELKKLINISRTNRKDFIKKYREEKAALIQYKIDNLDRKSCVKR